MALELFPRAVAKGHGRRDGKNNGRDGRAREHRGKSIKNVRGSQAISIGRGGTGITPAGRFYAVIEFDRYDRFAICAGARQTVIRRFSTHSDFRSGRGSSAFFRHDARQSSSFSRRVPSVTKRALRARGWSNILLAKALHRPICTSALVCIASREISARKKRGGPHKNCTPRNVMNGNERRSVFLPRRASSLGSFTYGTL